MPEGDSIHRVAGVLRPLLLDVPLVRVHIAGVAREELAGSRTTAVTPLGKHLTISLDSGWELRVHLGMYGRWRRYRAPRAAPASASLILALAADELACVRAHTIELTARRDPRRGRATAALGPDVLAEGFDPSAAVARARVAAVAAPTMAIGVALLDQRLACGIGNVYKSEILWLERISPFSPVPALSDEQLAALYARAAELMRQNLGPGPRVTRDPGIGPRAGRSAHARTWVYGRARRPCPRCQTPIATAVQGQQLRRTYFCPTCQPAAILPPLAP
jgi:endonuclease-8